MEIPALMSLHLKSIEQELRSEIDKYEQSDFTSEVNDLLNGVDGAFAKREHSFQRVLETKWDESEYLLQATYQYRLSIDWLKRDGDWGIEEGRGDIRIDNAFQWMMAAQFSLGAIHALTVNRQQNARQANKENIELKKQAKEYWLAHIDRNLSNDKAAEILKKQIPLSARVLSRYVSEAKKDVEMHEKMALLRDFHATIKNKIANESTFQIDGLKFIRGNTTS